MKSIADNYRRIKEDISNTALKCGRDPSEIKLVVVSKGHPIEQIQIVYNEGCRDFGENRVQEALEKIPAAPMDIYWHMIGTLQINKIKKSLGKFAMYHSIDTPELAYRIAKSSQELDLITPVLLQVNTSGESTKQGLSLEAWKWAFEEIMKLSGIKIEGLMTMAPYVVEESIIRECFSRLRLFNDELKKAYKIDLPELSMGMSHDYRLAIAEGATILRIGSAIFD